MLRGSCLAAAVLLAVSATNVFATVGGQVYAINSIATGSGPLKARMVFIDGPEPGDAGQVYVDVQGAGDYFGTYTTEGSPTVVTNYKITAIAPTDGHIAASNGTAIDLKQAGGSLGAVAKLLRLPGVTLGIGVKLSGELLFYSGTELLP
jgi:hypothetical protein